MRGADTPLHLHTASEASFGTIPRSAFPIVLMFFPNEARGRIGLRPIPPRFEKGLR